MKTFYLLGSKIVGVVGNTQPVFWGGILVPFFGRLEWPIPTINPQIGPYLVYRPLISYGRLNVFTGAVIYHLQIGTHQAGFQCVPTFSHTYYLTTFPEQPSKAMMSGMFFNLECAGSLAAQGLLSLKQLYQSKHISRTYNPPQPIFIYMTATRNIGSDRVRAVVWIGYLITLSLVLQEKQGFITPGFTVEFLVPPQ